VEISGGAVITGSSESWVYKCKKSIIQFKPRLQSHILHVAI
jgi:hypothetical protein